MLGRNNTVQLVNPRRSAHASIRGYLYQTCLGVLRWLDLGDDEILVCEGDEDLDRLLIAGGGISEQVKALTGSVNIRDRTVAEALRNFLLTYVALRQSGETRRFVFTTTARQRPQRVHGVGVDVLAHWSDSDHREAVIDGLRQMLRRVSPRGSKGAGSLSALTEALNWLDSDRDHWNGFIQSVEWSFDAPDLDGVRRRIADSLRHSSVRALPGETLIDRLVAELLSASSDPDLMRRQRTRDDLDRLFRTVESELARWAGTPVAVNLGRLFDELRNLRLLLHDGTRKFPRGQVSPGKLLTAAYEVIPFEEASRQADLDFLAAWCNRKTTASVLLLTGDGGTGKTRLMIEWCGRLRLQSWHAGFLHSDRSARQLDPLFQGIVPRLLVVDYAETRLDIVEPLLGRMATSGTREGPKLRLVLLARRKASWWKRLQTRNEAIEDLLKHSPQLQIASLAADDDTRSRVFLQAARAFARMLRREVPESLSSSNLSRGEFNRVLYLHMAALAAVDGEKIERAYDALERTLLHERRFWVREVGGIGLDRVQEEDLENALGPVVAALALTGGAASEERARKIIGRVSAEWKLSAPLQRPLLRLLHHLYGAPEAEATRYLKALEPDLLAEQLVWETLEGEGDASLTKSVLGVGNREERTNCLAILARLADRRPDTRLHLRAAIERVSRITRLLGAGIAAATVSVAMLAMLGVVQFQGIKKSAAAGRLANLALRHLDDNRLELALLLSAEAYRTSDLPETRHALLRTLQAAPRLSRILHVQKPDLDAPLISLAMSSGGTTLAAADQAGNIHLWDVMSGQSLGEPLQIQVDTEDPWITVLAFSHNGRILASGGDDSIVRLWDVGSRQPLGNPLVGHEGSSIASLAFSPDGTVLASGDENFNRLSEVLIWDVKNQAQEPVARLDMEGASVLALAFSKDGKFLIIGDNNADVQFWDRETRQIVRKLELPISDFELLETMAISGDSAFIAVGNQGIWDLETGARVGEAFDTVKVTFCPYEEDSSERGRFLDLLVSGHNDGTIELWSRFTSNSDFKNKEKIQTQGAGVFNNLACSSVSGHPGDNLVAEGRAAAVWIWELENPYCSSLDHQQPLGSYLASGEKPIPLSVAFSPKSGLLAFGAGSIVKWGHSVELVNTEERRWEASTGPVSNLVTDLPFDYQSDVVTSLAFSPDGRHLALGLGRFYPEERSLATVLMWDVERGMPIGKHIKGFGKQLRGLSFSPDGRYVAWCDRNYSRGHLALWDLKNNEEIRREPDTSMFFGPWCGPSAGDIRPAPLGVGSVAFSPNGNLLAFVKTDGSIEIETTSPRQVTGEPLPNEEGVHFSSVAFSPDGKLLATGSDGVGVVQLWDVETRQELAALYPGRLYDIDTTFLSGYGVRSVAFSPDGRLLASGGDVAGTSRLWDVATGEPIGEALTTGEIAKVAFSQDGSLLASAGSDGVRLWEVNPEIWRHHACRVANRNLTCNEWTDFFGGAPYRPICPELPPEVCDQ